MDWTTALTGVELNGIVDGIVAIVPIVAPVVIGMIAIKKGWRFLLSNLRGA
jgi:hypothetical protein